MQKLRPPTWRRSRTPTPVEMRSSGGQTATTTSCSAITSSSSLDLVSRQASSGGAANESHAPEPVQPSSQSSFLRLPVDPSTLIALSSTAAAANTTTTATNNNRGRSRSFDFSHHQEAAKSLSVDLGTNANQAGATASSGSGPLLGMLRRSFSRHSSTSDGQRSSAGCTTSAGAVGGSLSLGGAGSSGAVSSSAAAGSTFCVHCLCVEEYERLLALSPPVAGPPPYASLAAPTVPSDDLLSESEYDSNRSSSCCESAADDPHDAQLDEELDGGTSRLSFLGESFECRQKVEPWIRENETQLAPDSSARALIRRGRSLGLASDTSSTVLLGAAPNLRRGGSECQPDASRGQDEEQERESWSRQGCQISFNFSFSSSEPSTNYQVSDAGSTTPVGGRRSPGGAGTPRLERQEAFCSGWLESEPSLELLAPGHHSFGADPEHNNDDHSRHVTSSGSRTHASMETHASVSLEVDSGACVGVVQQASLESQYSLQLSLDVHLPESARHRVSSFESETSVDSMASSNVSTGVGGGAGAASGGRCSAGSGFLNRSSLLARRKCLSAGASPSSSPPICLSNSRYNLCSGSPGITSNSRLNLCTGSSSEYGDQADLEATPLSPSPPAEIYLTVPVLTPLATAAKTVSSGGSLLLDKSRHLRQRFRRNDSSKSSSDKDRDKESSLAASIQLPSTPQLTTQRSLTTTGTCSSLNAHGFSRSGDSLHPRSDLHFRSRSIEIGLPTAHHHQHHHLHHHHHHHRTEYHDLAGSARRQQWVSRLKYVSIAERESLSSVSFFLFFRFSRQNSLNCMNCIASLLLWGKRGNER